MSFKDYIPATIVPLGVTADGTIVIWSSDNNRLHRVRLRDLTMPELIAIGGEDAVDAVVGLMDKDSNPVQLIQKGVASAARDTVFSHRDVIGQGVWRVNGKLLIVSQNEAYWYTPDDQQIWTKIGKPVVGRSLIDLTDSEWIYLDQLRIATDYLTPPEIKATFEELVGYIRAWTLQNADDALMLAALVMATCIQGFLDTRPQVWVTGPTSTGKSQFRKFLRVLWPHAFSGGKKTSEAGVRQTCRNNCVPVLLDEQEPHPGRDNLLALMRHATLGDSVTKGSPSGPIEYTVKCISWWFSIDANLESEADRNRFIVFEMVRKAAGDRFVFPKIPGNFGTRLVACAIRCSYAIDRKWKELSAAADQGRLYEVYSVPAAVYGVMTGADAKQFLDRTTAAALIEIPNESESEKLLTALMMAVPKQFDASISMLLTREVYKDMGQDALEMSGIRRRLIKGFEDFIFVYPPLVAQTLLNGPEWKGHVLDTWFKRILGARKHKVQLSSGQNPVWGVLLPRKLLIAQESQPVITKLDPKELPAPPWVPPMRTAEVKAPLPTTRPMPAPPPMMPEQEEKEMKELMDKMNEPPIEE